MEKRVEVLREYELLDTLPEQEFDDIVELASVFFHTPMSLITLLDSERQWFKAKVGLDGTETPLEYAYCYHAIQRPQEVMVVPDSLQDERFRDNPFTTGDPHVRFYAGAPLVTPDGYALGTLCVVDQKPREFDEEQKRVLRILANKVIERFESRKKNLESKRQLAAANASMELALGRLLEAERIAGIGNWSYNTQTKEIYWSPEMYRIYGLPDQDAVFTFDKWMQMIHPDDLGEFTNGSRQAFAEGKPFSQEFRIRRADGEERWMLSTLEFTAGTTITGTTLDITERKKAEVSRRQYTEALEHMLFALSHNVRKPVANILGIGKVFDKKDLSQSDIKECVPMLQAAAKELDGYIHELNDFISKHKTGLNGKS